MTSRNDAAHQLIVVDDAFARDIGDDVFEACMNLSGETVRDVAHRRTLRVSLSGRCYYAKIHTGVGWREVLKNALRLRRPVLSAVDEWRAIHAVQRLGVRSTPPVAFGMRGRNPARIESFLITRDIGESVSLEDLAQHDHGKLSGDTKRRLVNEVARIVRTLHSNGINHRDLYLCHFRVVCAEWSGVNAENGSLVLMDLHRAQIRRTLGQRWIVKDLGGLLFSALDAPLTLRDALRFARRYREAPLRQVLQRDAKLWQRVWRRAMGLYRQHSGRTPSAPIVVQWEQVGRG